MSIQIQHTYQPTSIWREIHEHPARFKVVVMGRRSGKSTGALNQANFICSTQPKSKVWIVGPTFTQVRDIYWYDEKMKEYLIPELIAKKNESELLIKYKNGSILQFKGAEREEGLVGSGLDFLICDEVSKWKKWYQQWEQNLRPTIADKNGGVIFITTPQGYDHAYELYEYAEKSGDPDWKAWRVATWDSGVDWVEKSEGKKFLTKEKERMTEDAYMQEYGAEFRKFAGLVFPEFDRSIHVEDFEVNEKFAIECGMDFGTRNPTVCLFAYFDDNDTMWIFDEYYKVGLPILEHAGQILALRNKYHNPLRYVVGDSASPQQIMEYGQHNWFITPVNKLYGAKGDRKNSIQIGISRIRKRLKINPLTGKPGIIIHSRCVNTPNEFERWAWDEQKLKGKNFKEMPQDKDNDAIDTIRYILLHHKQKQEVFIKPIKRQYKPYSSIDNILNIKF